MAYKGGEQVPVDLPSGQKASFTPQEWSDYTTTGKVPFRYLPKVTASGGAVSPEADAVISADIARNGNPAPKISFGSNKPVTSSTPTFGLSRNPDEAAQAAADIEAKKSEKMGFQTSGQKYVDALHDTVSNEYALVNRNKQIIPLLDTYKSGGIGAEERLHFGNDIANTTWLPQSVRDMGNKIAGGDAVSGKVLENQIAAAAITTMLDTLKGEGKPNTAIFKALSSAQEGIRSGNTTLKDVFALQERLYQMHYDEQQAITGAMKDGTYNPQTWAGDYSAIRNKALSTPAAPLPSKAGVRVFDPTTGKFK
jgi:hypothetical protein